MNHQQQPHNACFPTALAMIYDVPVEQVIRYGLSGTRFKTWSDIHPSKLKYTYACIRILIKWPAPLAMALGKCRNPNTSDITNPPQPLPSGKGMITLNWLFLQYHVVAFEDQMVHCSNRPEGIPWLDYYKQMTDEGWKFTEIRVIEVKK